jgi:hypothetical protein
MRGLTKSAALVVTLFTIAAQPAQACWDDAAQNAAKISNFNMMLMVTALRCRGGSDNFLTEYNQFVRKNNALLGSQNSLIRSHFAATLGGKGAETALDKLATGYANSYGAGHASMGCKELKALATQVANQPMGVSTLTAIADNAVGNAPLPGGRCNISIAERK